MSNDPRIRVNLKLLLQTIEADWILETLRATKSVSKSAHYLCMNRTTLIEKMRRYNIRYRIDVESEKNSNEDNIPSIPIDP